MIKSLPGRLCATLELIRSNQALNGISEKDATIIHLGRQLYGDRKVDSATFARAGHCQ